MTEAGRGALAAGERYERVDRIATGGMGEVWRARDTVLGRQVAVKVLKQEYADDPSFRARFEAEARHAAGLHHPHIASVFDYGELGEDRTPYLVMELVEGKPLSELLAGGRPFDPEQARALTVQTAEALAAAHAAGVVHRDVKPGNILVTPDGRVKITDFGIARAADSAAITRTGQIIGTPHYLSPEQAAGKPATAASDVYALGVVLFECLTGHRPFQADTPVATALAHLREPVPPLPDSVPADLAAVTTKALAKDPADRYADGGELAAALGAGVPPDAPPATQVLSPAAAPVAATQVVARRERGALATALADRTRWPLYVTAVLGLLLFVLLLVAHPWSGQDSEGSTGSSGEPTTSASTTPSPTGSTTTAASTVRVTKADYVGRPVAEVRSDLEALGLTSTVKDKANDGTHQAGTVADLSPSGSVKAGSSITLQVWSTAPSTTGKPGKGDGKGKGKKGD